MSCLEFLSIFNQITHRVFQCVLKVLFSALTCFIKVAEENDMSSTFQIRFNRTIIIVQSIIVIRYRGISQKSHKWHFQFSIWLKSSLEEVHFADNLTWIGPVVPKLKQLKDSQNNRKQKKCIPFSGCILQSMRPTSDWSC